MQLRERKGVFGLNKLYVVGIGPGAYEDMTIRAAKVLEQCDVIIGYTVYVDLVRQHFADKKFLTTPMKQEIERCEMAFSEAEAGHTTAMICSGDAGVYGMAGLILGMQEEHPSVVVEVIPGVTAALSGAAVLGAPLIHDFALISLSDLMKPCEILLTCKAKETVCGIVRNIGREGESYQICSLQELKEIQTDMFTTVFIGNSQTKQINGHMVTPRGYRNE